MKITAVELEDVLSFGPRQRLGNLARFNLFIGPNGSGKTNALRILAMNFSNPVTRGEVLTKTDTGMHAARIYTAEIPLEFVNRHRLNRHKENTHRTQAMVRVDYEQFDGPASLVFEDEVNTVGDIGVLQSNVATLVVPDTDDAFYSDISRLQPVGFATLNFALRHIFRRTLFFDASVNLIELQSRHPGVTDGGTWSGKPGPSTRHGIAAGVQRCARLLVAFLLHTRPSVILIDEPELHLEAGALRRLYEVLVWLSIGNVSPEELNQTENAISASLDQKWQEWAPYWARRADLDLPEPTDDVPFVAPIRLDRQLFVCSHSGALMNEFLRLGSAATIHEFASVRRNNPQWSSRGEDLGHMETLFTEVRKLDLSTTTILDSLGIQGSDVLRANGVIWVEGPSDIVYIQRWIELYCNASNLLALRKGTDYEFQIYGGALLDALSVTDDGTSVEEQQRKLVSMFSLARHAYIVIDGDAVTRDGVATDNSTFSASKQFISNQVEELRKGGHLIGLWYEQGNTEIYSIEDYLDAQTLKTVGDRRSMSKRKYAQKVAATWPDHKPLSDFPHELEQQISQLVSVIRSWSS